MLFMSEKQKDVTVRNQKKLFSPSTGEKIGTQRRVFAEFRKGGVPSWALPLALERFEMAGKPPEIAPQMWLSVYDSQEDQRTRGWTDEERTLIEEKLLAKADVVQIETPKIKAPYVKYDQHRKVQGRRTIEKVIEDITAVFESAGFDVGQAVAYERQNLNDETVIAALEALAGEPEPVEEEVVAA